MVVLRQIQAQSKRFPVFVACRIGEIHELSEVNQWHWVPSDQNVADLATKEFKAVDLCKDSLWMKGPEFLRRNQETWPKQFNVVENEGVLLVDVEENKINSILPDITRFSKWLRLVRTTAWVVRWIEVTKLPKSNRPSSLTLDAELINEAHKMWIKKCQTDCFYQDLKLLRDKKNNLPKSSRLFKLSAFVDQEGIIRLSGRIPGNTDINYETKYPIILDSKHKYTELLIKHAHESSGHIGFETVVNNLRIKYWIIGLRPGVKKCFHQCQQCRIRQCKPITPEMGYLPKERLESFIPPFTYVGIDLFGPMTVLVGRRTEKRYGVLFTCLTVRAIHIEIAASLDTSSTVSAIRRFICRRGQPKEFRTDNGTNFIGSQRELKEWYTIDQEEIEEFLANKGITWKFNPPSAPHMGGIWERMIRSVKTALKIVLKTVKPKEEVLSTLLTEIEYMMNCRPLTHISVDPAEPEAITPNHFLLLRPGGVTSGSENSICSRKQWRVAQALADAFWKRWVREYRPTLISRSKWQSKNESVRIDDIVIIVDDKMPRNEWLMGRITRVFPGKDHTVRVAEVRTKKGHFIRPVYKLCRIPVEI